MQLRLSLCNAGRSAALAVSIFSMAVSPIFAQATAKPQTPAPAQQMPAAPTASPTLKAPSFPPPNPRFFTATQPTKDEVDAFLRASWGYDTNRVWQVEAIQKTAAPGVSKVTVFVAQKNNPKQTARLVFFVTPDGKHLISNEVLPFGPHPFEAARQTLQAEAKGPSKGPATSSLELVEFADFECPHCKAAQPVIAKLLQDFPKAHYVFENFPLVSIHPEAYKAAAYSVCVAKLGGNDAFFKFADAVFDDQANLTPTAADKTLTDAATKAGVDAAKVTACSTTPEAKAAVDASVKLAQDLDVKETPTLFINGRPLPVNAVPYETLKSIVNYQIQLDKGNQ